MSLTNGVAIRSGRLASAACGESLQSAWCDEAGFWYTEFTGSANSDTEILDGCRAVARDNGRHTRDISTPYAKRGEAYETTSRDYGEKGDPRILVAQGATGDFDESLPRRASTKRWRDSAAGVGEYLGLFRTDIAALIDRETIEARVSRGVSVRAPLAQFNYVGGVDHRGAAARIPLRWRSPISRTESRCSIASLRRKPPLSPEAVTAEFAAVLKEYRISTVRGDRYAGLWPAERFREHGITYEPADMNRSEIYLAFLPMLTSGKVDLLDHPRMINQFVGLERRTARSGKDSVDWAV